MALGKPGKRQEETGQVNLEKQPRGTFFALALIVAGTLLFLDNLGVLPVENVGDFWPLALVLYGAGMLWYHRSATAFIWSGTLILAGILLVLGNLHMLRVTVGGLWPLILIAVGATLLVERQGWDPEWFARLKLHEWPTREERLKWKAERWRLRQERWQKKDWFHGRFAGSSFAAQNFADAYWQTAAQGGRVHDVAVFFGAKRREETSDFRGGTLVAAFGSIEIDLSLCSIQPVPAAEPDGVPTRYAILDASAIFGAIEILVPPTWRIVRKGAGVFGSYEDKTIPRPEPGVEQSTLIIRGGAIFGSVEIRN